MPTGQRQVNHKLYDPTGDLGPWQTALQGAHIGIRITVVEFKSSLNRAPGFTMLVKSKKSI
jgi:hypothetical protein